MGPRHSPATSRRSRGRVWCMQSAARRPDRTSPPRSRAGYLPPRHTSEGRRVARVHAHVRADAHHEPDESVSGRLDGTDEGQDARIVKSAAQTFNTRSPPAPSPRSRTQVARLDRPSHGGAWIRRRVPRRAELRARPMLLPPADDVERLRAAAERPGATELARHRHQQRRRGLQGQLVGALRRVPDRATITMEENADTYWMMYESGGPSGSHGRREDAVHARPDGSQTT